MADREPVEVTYVDSEADWIGIFHDGTLVWQGHQDELETYLLSLENITIESVEYRRVDTDWLVALRRYPQKYLLSDAPLLD